MNKDNVFLGGKCTFGGIIKGINEGILRYSLHKCP